MPTRKLFDDKFSSLSGKPGYSDVVVRIPEPVAVSGNRDWGGATIPTSLNGGTWAIPSLPLVSKYPRG